MNHRRDLNEFEREQHRKAPKGPHPYGALYLAIIAMVFAALSAWLLYREAILPWSSKSEIVRWTIYIVTLLGVAVFMTFSYIRRASGKAKKARTKTPEQHYRNFVIWTAAAFVSFIGFAIFIWYTDYANRSWIVEDGLRLLGCFSAAMAAGSYRESKKKPEIKEENA